MEFRIYIDTNRIFLQKEEIKQVERVFNSTILDLKNFINTNKLNNVKICLPEIVIKEIIQKRIESIEKDIDLIDKAAVRLELFGYKLNKTKKDKNYKTVLEETVEKFIKDNKLEKIKLGGLDLDNIIERAINKIRPFKDRGVGFKDTLIYLSIINDALKQKSDTGYILWSNDSDFDEKTKQEFKEKTGKKIYITRSIEETQELLDKLIPLNLHLEERNKKIKDLIYKNIGEIVLFVNKTISNNKNKYTVNSDIESLHTYQVVSYDDIVEHSFSTVPRNTNKVVIAYSFSDINFIDFQQISENTYNVNLYLETNIVYKNEIENSNYGFVNYSYLINGPLNKKIFNLDVKCNLENSLISIYLR